MCFILPTVGIQSGLGEMPYHEDEAADFLESLATDSYARGDPLPIERHL